jgi:hypothetical protein
MCRSIYRRALLGLLLVVGAGALVSAAHAQSSGGQLTISPSDATAKVTVTATTTGCGAMGGGAFPLLALASSLLLKPRREIRCATP